MAHGIDGDSGCDPCHHGRVSHYLYVHVAWGTRGGLPLVDAARAALVDRYVRAVGRRDRCQVIAIGMATTHVHLLLRLNPTTSVARLLQRIKGGSARLANRGVVARGGARLRWARGAEIHSVSSAAVAAVRDYVRDQADHHPNERVAGVA
jgi:REP element-mobilizing transposase RayT